MVPPVAASVSEYDWPTVPPGRLVVVIVGGGTGSGSMVTVSSWVSDCEGVLASSTLAVKVNLPALVGCPVSSPVGRRSRPGGGVPAETDHVYGGVPSTAASVCPYVVPTVPSGRLVVVIVGGGTGAVATEIESACVSLCVAASVTLAVKGDTPVVVGVPVIAPVEAFKVSPAGSDPESSDQV